MALKDDYLNWFPINLTTGANSTTLTEAYEYTNAGASEKIAWRIHKIEWHLGLAFPGVDNASFTMALSTRRGLTAMPTLTDLGLIGRLQCVDSIITSGYVNRAWPIVHDYLPPFVLAGSSISLYWQASTNDATWQSQTVRVRIGYTMVRIAGDMWSEIFQTWNFSS